MEIVPSAEASLAGTRDWPHAPPHRLRDSGVYFVTARTSEKRHLFHTPELRDWFQETLFTAARQHGWTLEAWAVLSNHYHLIAHSPTGQPDATSLKPFLTQVHALSTKHLNRLDNTPGRSRLWHNYRETHLTLQRGYLARLNYVHRNAVHHKLVVHATDWKWCSAKAFCQAVTPAWAKTIASFPFDEIATEDGE